MLLAPMLLFVSLCGSPAHAEPPAPDEMANPDGADGPAATALTVGAFTMMSLCGGTIATVWCSSALSAFPVVNVVLACGFPLVVALFGGAGAWATAGALWRKRVPLVPLVVSSLLGVLSGMTLLLATIAVGGTAGVGVMLGGFLVEGLARGIIQFTGFVVFAGAVAISLVALLGGYALGAVATGILAARLGRRTAGDEAILNLDAFSVPAPTATPTARNAETRSDAQ